MSDKQDNEISACIDRLEREVALLRELSLPATAQILEMAILELRMALHAISRMNCAPSPTLPPGSPRQP
jgi:hypothetical protein